MSHHPITATLESFVNGDLPAGEVRAIVEHLLGGCAVCRRRGLDRAPFLADGWLADGDPGGGGGAEHEAAYDEAIRRAVDGVLLHGDRVLDHKARTRRLLAILRRTAGVSEHRLTPHRGRRPALYEAYLARSWELRVEDPQRTVVFARLACRLAGDLGQDGYTARQVADFEARAWGELGNALRIAGHYAEAESTLMQAFDHWAAGSRAARLRNRLFELSASLQGALKRNREAIATLTLVHAMCLEDGDRHGAGRALMSKALFTSYAGEPLAALALLREGLAAIDRRREPELEAIGLHNELLFLVDAGSFREARRFLWQHRARLVEGEGRLQRTRLTGLEGRIHAGLGELERAERCFRAARSGFEEDGLALPASTAVIELAAVCMRQGRWEEASELGERAADTFMAHGIQGEGLMAVVTLQKAFELRLATSVLVETVAAFLRRHENDASARFEIRIA